MGIWYILGVLLQKIGIIKQSPNEKDQISTVRLQAKTEVEDLRSSTMDLRKQAADAEALLMAAEATLIETKLNNRVKTDGGVIK